MPAERTKAKKFTDLAITILSAAVGLLYIYLSYAGMLPTFQQRGILLAFCFVLIFIKFPLLKSGRPLWTIAIDVVLSLVVLISVYQLIKIEITTPPAGYYTPKTFDIVLMCGLIIAVLEGTRRALGMALPILCIAGIIYALFGHDLPGLFRHVYISLNFIVYYLGMTVEGIWGLPIYVVATVVILFMIFSSFLEKCGLLQFFIELSNALVGRFRGGPAKVAVFASAILATISGSATANVAAVGVFTIPLMKRVGYSPEFAGAVESCASTGGVVTPPVMGAAAFIIAEYLGVSYWSVCAAAAIPAFLYYLGVYVGVDLEAVKLKMGGAPRGTRSTWQILKDKGHMLIPIFLLTYLLGVLRYPGALACFWAIISVIVLALITKDTRKNILGWGFVEALAGGIKGSLVVVATCASAGIIVGSLVVTGLAFRFNLLLISLTGGNLLLLLILSALVCIILGMGMTTTSVYLLMALVVAPAIIELGVPPLSAHLFVFFLGNLSHITPPVAIAVFVACGISGGKILETAIQSCKLGAILFVMPFFFVLNPTLIMQGNTLDIVLNCITAIIGVITLSFGFSGCTWLGRINTVQRLLFGAGGLLLAYPGLITSIIGGSTALLTGLSQYRSVKRVRANANTETT